MRRALAVVLLVACTRAGDPTDPAPAPTPTAPAPTPVPAVAPIPKPVPTPVSKSAARVELTSVTLADDCGGLAPSVAPAKQSRSESDDPAPPAAGGRRDARSRSPARRRCEQTSMQIAIVSGDAATLHVKSVELFDERGKSLGKLTASKPTRWSSATSTYEAWDETLGAGETSASYVLSQPKWDHIADRWNKTFTLKTVLTVGGVDQKAQKDVTLTAPASLPPNIRT